MPLVEKAALFYGHQRWPGCRLISITPYFALDGTVNAYAVQFAKSGTELSAETELAGQVTPAEDAVRAVRENRPLAARNDRAGETIDIEGPQYARASVVGEPIGGSAPVIAYVPPGAQQGADIRRQEAWRAEQELAAWRAQVREAENASVLADEVGTVIVAARYDLYPLLERFDGVAPHLKFESKVRALAGAPALQVSAVRRSYYLGPLAVFHEVTVDDGGAKVLLVDPLSVAGEPEELNPIQLPFPENTTTSQRPS